MSKQAVDSQIYQENYYLKAFGGEINNYLESLKRSEKDNRFKEVFRVAGLKKGERVLDVGCGRGELIYFSLLEGAKSAVGIDYSEAALSIAGKIAGILPPQTRSRLKFINQNVSSIKLEEGFDCCFLTDIVEHLTDEQLYGLFSELRKYLSANGRIIIHTAPNINWIRFEYPLKRFLTIPSTIIKRITGKKPFTAPRQANFLRKIIAYLDLCYTRDYYNYSPRMHINEQSPAFLKKLLRKTGFDCKIWCEDGSSNFISILCKRFWGPDIWAVARLKKQ
ncbi:MAG: methyltransferase domain-containing protein [Candidatus Omnitrophota bacterium]